MNDERVNQLIREAVAHRLSRRDILKRAAVAGLSVPALASVLAATSPLSALAQDAANPLAVDPAAPLMS